MKPLLKSIGWFLIASGLINIASEIHTAGAGWFAWQRWLSSALVVTAFNVYGYGCYGKSWRVQR